MFEFTSEAQCLFPRTLAPSKEAHNQKCEILAVQRNLGNDEEDFSFDLLAAYYEAVQMSPKKLRQRLTIAQNNIRAVPGFPAAEKQNGLGNFP